MCAAFLHGATATVLWRVQLGFENRASLPFSKRWRSDPLHPASPRRRRLFLVAIIIIIIIDSFLESFEPSLENFVLLIILTKNRAIFPFPTQR
jgi:hypothetical protein